jgi:pyrimidine 5'-nucleotidase
MYDYTPIYSLTPILLRRYIFLDLDDTLYPKSSNINVCVRDRIAQYLSEILHIENADEKSMQLYLQHGTTLRGLIHEGYDIDQSAFYHYVHTGFTIDDKIPRNDVQLLNLLQKLKDSPTAQVQLILFTNSDMGHATRITNHLGIKHMFDAFISFEDLGLTCKPHRVAFEIAMQTAGIDQEFTQQKMGNTSGKPIEIYFFDDNIANVRAAIDIGWHKAIMINEKKVPVVLDNETLTVLDIQDIHQMDQVCPELFL